MYDINLLANVPVCSTST